MLLLLHSAFMLSMVKMLLKGEDGGKIAMEIKLLIMENHGIVFLNLCVGVRSFLITWVVGVRRN